MSFDIPRWQLHRGYWRGGLRENTLQAFMAAKGLGVEMVELDVRLSKEKVPVVFHDTDLNRFFHIDEKVSETSIDDLQGLNIPKLSQVLQKEETPEWVNIEIKSQSPLCYQISKRVVEEAIKARKKKIMISSFNPVCLAWVKRWAPKIPRGLLISDTKFVTGWRFAFYLKISDPNYLNVDYRLLENEKTRDLVISQEKPVIVWTVNSLEKAEFYLERGAASIISDEPPKPNN